MTDSNGQILDDFYSALARKDLPGVLACCAPDAIFWHNFDGICQSPEQAAEGWRGMFDSLQEHGPLDVRREILGDTVIQRHLFVMGRADGTRIGKPCCILARIFDGRIQRLDEYIDLSSQRVLEAGDDVTWGLPADGRFL